MGQFFRGKFSGGQFSGGQFSRSPLKGHVFCTATLKSCAAAFEHIFYVEDYAADS